MALVGLTGSGKTTLTALATRLYDVTGGRIVLDDVDIRDLTRDELRRHIAMGFEDATLFSASVRDNVLLGRPEFDEGARREEGDAVMAEALEIAQADFVHELPEGGGTLICFSHLRWNFVYQRPQHLMSRFARDRKVIVWEEPIHDAPSATLDTHVCDCSGVTILTPHLPAGLSRSVHRAEVHHDDPSPDLPRDAYRGPQLPDALEALEQYSFPGNIRELENILERAVTLSEDAVIDRRYLRLNSPLLEGQAHWTNF